MFCPVERKETVAALATAFDVANKRGEWADAKRLAIRLRYLENVETACREWAPGKRIELQH